MAKRSIGSYAVILLLVLVLAISEIETVNAKYCEKTSKMWSGKCEPKKCDKKCIGWEKAIHGACHKREAKTGCYCYFECGKKKGGSPAPPAPPADGGSPPADGGGSPPAEGDSPPPPAQK